MGNQQETKLDWFIGFMEGEGCFDDRYFDRVKANGTIAYYDCGVRISNNELDLIKICQDFLHQNYILTRIHTTIKGKKNPEHRLKIGGLKDCKILWELVRSRMECRSNEFASILGSSTTTRETTPSLGWLCGFYEAEAHFTIATQYHKGGYVSHRPSVVVDNTNMKAIDKIVKTLYSLGLSWHVSDRIPENPKYKVGKIIRIEGYKRVNRFLIATGGQWLGKKTSWKTVLIKEFCESRLSKTANSVYDEREQQIALDLIRSKKWS